MVSYSLTQEQVAIAMGKSRSSVANVLRLLDLTPEETEHLKKGNISQGHAKVILSAEKSSELRRALLKAALGGASVRELEAMIKSFKGSTKKTVPLKNNFYTEVELSLKEELKRKVKVTPTGKNKGTITLEFYSDEELKDFAHRLVKGE